MHVKWSAAFPPQGADFSGGFYPPWNSHRSLFVLLTGPAAAQEVQVDRVIAMMDGNARTAIKTVPKDNNPTVCIVIIAANLRGVTQDGRQAN